MKSSVVAALLLFHKGVGLSTKSAIKYAVEAQKLERELTEVALYKPRSWSAAHPVGYQMCSVGREAGARARRNRSGHRARRFGSAAWIIGTFTRSHMKMLRLCLRVVDTLTGRRDSGPLGQVRFHRATNRK